MIAVKIIMAKSIAEEIEAFRSARLGRRLIVSDREAGDHRDVRVDAVAHRHAGVGLDDVIIFVAPFPRLVGADESEGERPHAEPGRHVDCFAPRTGEPARSEEHTSELQSLMRNSYAVFCLKT